MPKHIQEIEDILNYKISGAVAGGGNYESDYENGNTPEEQYELLLDGEALKLALLQEVE